MRVNTGKAKGTNLKVSAKSKTRPITSLAKEKIFSYISNELIESSFLDLFAGSGSVGIEALSRGAYHATFVDCNFSAIQSINQNIVKCGFEEQAKAIQQDVLSFIKQNNLDFDFIFAGPPFSDKIYSKFVLQLNEIASKISPSVVLILEQELHQTKLPISFLQEINEICCCESRYTFHKSKI